MAKFIGAENVLNPGFELDLTIWGASGVSGGTGTAAHETSTTHASSAGSVKLTHSNDTGEYQIGQGMSLKPNCIYRVSAWVYIPSADVPSDHVRLALTNFGYSPSADANLATTNAWQELRITAWNPLSDAVGQLVLRVDDATGGGGAFVYFDDVSVKEISILTEGPKPAHFRPVEVGLTTNLTEANATGFVSESGTFEVAIRLVNGQAITAGDVTVYTQLEEGDAVYTKSSVTIADITCSVDTIFAKISPGPGMHKLVLANVTGTNLNFDLLVRDRD